MTNRPHLAAMSLGVALLALSCGDDGGETIADPPAPVTSRRPPPPPQDPSLGETTGTTYAVTQWRFGGVQLGYDLDGVQGEAAGEVCQPLVDAARFLGADGDLGVDNAFAAGVVPALEAVRTTLSSDINALLATDEYTVLFDAQGLGSQANYTGLLVQGMQGASKMGDVWLASPLSRSTPALYDASYVNEGILVAGPALELQLDLEMADTQLVLPLRQSVVTMELSDDRATVRNGIIAGVIHIDDLEAAVRAMFANIADCSSADAVAEAIRASADIMRDGAQDPSASCDAVSFAIGFDAARTEWMGVGAERPQLMDMCGG